MVKHRLVHEKHQRSTIYLLDGSKKGTHSNKELFPSIKCESLHNDQREREMRLRVSKLSHWKEMWQNPSIL